jgi:hypothetical protein
VGNVDGGDADDTYVDGTPLDPSLDEDDLITYSIIFG